MLRLWMISWLLGASLQVTAAETIEIDVVGLFKDVAMLRINGEQQLLKIGQRSPEGVLLLSADSRGATIEVDGEALSLDLSSHISAEFSAQVPTTVAIRRDNNQYHTTGSINGVPVTFFNRYWRHNPGDEQPSCRCTGSRYASRQTYASNDRWWLRYFAAGDDQAS